MKCCDLTLIDNFCKRSEEDTSKDGEYWCVIGIYTWSVRLNDDNDNDEEDDDDDDEEIDRDDEEDKGDGDNIDDFEVGDDLTIERLPITGDLSNFCGCIGFNDE